MYVGRGDVEMLQSDVRVGVKRTAVVEMFNLIMARRHQAREKVKIWVCLGKKGELRVAMVAAV